MSEAGRRALFWAPRVLSIAYILFLSMFALDVFTETHGFWRILGAVIIHLLPSLILVAGLILAWRWEWIGAALYGAAGAVYISWVLHRSLSSGTKLTWILLIAMPAFFVATLYMANWLRRGELHGRRP